jgi:hypothetical protein
MERLLDAFVRIFGSKWHFFIGLACTIVWLFPIFTMGFDDWNDLIGLAGNNYESTAEYFLEIAILYTTSTTERRTAKMRDSQARQLTNIETLVAQLVPGNGEDRS